jgi:hypothetical protein
MGKVEVIKEFIAQHCDNVRRLRKQISDKDIESLLDNYTVEQITAQLANMENYKPLTAKYTSVYLTLLKWFRIDEQRAAPHPTASKPQAVAGQVAPFTDNSLLDMRKKRFFAKYPVGSTFLSPNGTEYIVESEEFLRDPLMDAVIPITLILRRDVV